MPINRENCDNCGHFCNACPDCGSTHVTPFEMADPDRPFSMSIAEFVRSADRGESADFQHTCWDCGWEETWTISVD